MRIMNNALFTVFFLWLKLFGVIGETWPRINSIDAITSYGDQMYGVGAREERKPHFWNFLAQDLEHTGSLRRRTPVGEEARTYLDSQNARLYYIEAKLPQSRSRDEIKEFQFELESNLMRLRGARRSAKATEHDHRMGEKSCAYQAARVKDQRGVVKKGQEFALGQKRKFGKNDPETLRAIEHDQVVCQSLDGDWKSAKAAQEKSTDRYDGLMPIINEYKFLKRRFLLLLKSL